MLALRVKTAEAVLRERNPTLYYALGAHRTHRGKPLDFVNNPFIRRLYQDTHPDISVMKSTQCGVSEWLLCTVIPGAIMGRNIFYVLPDGSLIGRFVKERFDKTVKLTPAYTREIRGYGYQAMAAIGIKQFLGTIAFTGSTMPKSFTEFAADWYIIDELDRCDQTNLEMGWERLSAAETKHRRVIQVSNPTITGYGIDEAFAATDKHFWFIRHDCGAQIHPDFFEHVVREVDGGNYVYRDEEFDPEADRDVRMICDKCGKPINRRAEGEWVPEYPKRRKRGYQISKLFSANVELRDIVERFEKGQTDPEAMVRFYNGDLGLPYDASGARITRDDLNECKADYNLGEVPADGVTIAGIDVGSVYNVIIGHLTYGQPGVRIVEVKAVRETEEVKILLDRYKVKCYVVDANPETREAKKIISWRRGGFIAYYHRGHKDLVTNQTVSVDRTMALDNVRSAVVEKYLKFPKTAEFITDFYDQMIASVRMFDPEANGGEGEYRWVEGSHADHYMHAMSYMLIAGRLLVLAGR